MNLIPKEILNTGRRWRGNMKRIMMSIAAVIILLCQLYLAGCTSGSADQTAAGTAGQATVSAVEEASAAVEQERETLRKTRRLPSKAKTHKEEQDI